MSKKDKYRAAVRQGEGMARWARANLSPADFVAWAREQGEKSDAAAARGANTDAAMYAAAYLTAESATDPSHAKGGVQVLPVLGPRKGEAGFVTGEVLVTTACLAGGFVAGKAANAKFPEGVDLGPVNVPASAVLGVGEVVAGVALKKAFGMKRMGRGLIVAGVGSGLASFGAKKKA
jgi:hypothetical protein